MPGESPNWCWPAMTRRQRANCGANSTATTWTKRGRAPSFLVAAGPGAADLLTLRAHRLLGEADVIVHDRLVGDEVLALARREAAMIDVGKAPGTPCLPQEAINELLVRLACRHRKVVRLKGGDPFIFGRGGEETEALSRAGVPFEVVPGVTAALACAAQARIPLTLRGVARSVTLVTGHTKDGMPDLDFAVAARIGGTLAVYMGLAALPRLRDGLLRHGMPPEMPAALIENGGTHRQRELRGTLLSVAAEAASWSTGGPALLLVGEVVGRDAQASRRNSQASAQAVGVTGSVPGWAW
jgi:uroporphyrin-III C-methyltransferase / precorrin-2 dehydrogenase / sirohydrochlorin ferrochelatase